MSNISLMPRNVLEEYHKSYKVTQEQCYLIDFENRYALNSLHKIFIECLTVSPSLKLIELGCAPGSWLHYFATYFQYKTYGVELSYEGCLKTISNLGILNVKSKVICGDILSLPLKFNSFDIVFSGGLIEHFKDPDYILQLHFDLVKKDGIVIIIIPNYSYLNKLYLKIKVKEKTFFNSHNLNICGMRGFSKIINKKNILIEYLGYCGTFYPDIYPRRNNPDPINTQDKLGLSNRKVTAFLRKFPKFECFLFSPLILFIGKKNKLV